jgi:hypothetical protein
LDGHVVWPFLTIIRSYAGAASGKSQLVSLIAMGLPGFEDAAAKQRRTRAQSQPRLTF